MTKAMHIVIDKKRLSTLCLDHDVSFVGLFGSVARGEATKLSDVDVLVTFGHDKSLLEQVRIERAFARLFGRSVDLVTTGSVSPHIRRTIQKDLTVLYEKTR